MSETLFIRLGSKPTDKIHWLIFSTAHQEIIASGELAGATELSQLSEKAKTRQVTTLVPSCDIALKSLTVPGKSQRAIRLAAPYMLEDELAQDVEQLFFAYANLANDEQGNNCFTAAVEKQLLNNWLSWLKDADIVTKKMIPDALAMPLVTNGFSAVMLDDQILVKQAPWQAIAVDRQSWPYIVNHWLSQQAAKEDSTVIEHYSALPELADDIATSDSDSDSDSDSESESESEITFTAKPEELPLALLAQHSYQVSFNLLQGDYQYKEERSPVLTNWLWAASIAVLALLLNLGMKGAQLYELNEQQAAVEKQIVATYKKTFPASKRVRVNTVKSVLKQKLNEMGKNADNEGFLTMLAKLRPAFISVPQLRPQTLKFEGKRSEVRIQAKAKDYQAFERFKVELEKEQLTVTQGSQSNQGDSVSGSFSIKG